MRNQPTPSKIRGEISRRELIKGCGTAASALSFAGILWGDRLNETSPLTTRGAATRLLNLHQDWLFATELNESALEPEFDDKALGRVSIPHCAAPLSWQDWNPANWEKLWFYRRHFALPREFSGHRIFIHFEHVMAAAMPVVNGHKLPQHLGGFLPFQYEITDIVNKNDNLLAVAVDSRWINVPPEGSPKGPSSIDYMLPGGITGSVSLRAVPQIFIADVFAKPVDVLKTNQRLEVICSIDCGVVPKGIIHLQAALKDGDRLIASSHTTVRPQSTGESQATLSITG